MTNSALTLTKAKAHEWTHAVGDKRKATRYEVRDEARVLGTVESRSEESWNKTGRIRTHFNGYARYWAAECVCCPYPSNIVGRLFYTRAKAIEALLKHST